MLAVAIAGSVVAVLAGVYAWWPWQRGNVRAGVFAEQIVRLASSGNLPRARKLCAAAPHSVFVAATGHALARLADARIPVDPARDAETTAWLREQFQEHLAAGARAIARPGAQLVAAIGIGAAIAGVAAGAPPVSGVGGLVGLVLLGSAWRLARQVARAAIDHAERMHPAIALGRGSLLVAPVEAPPPPADGPWRAS